MTAASPSPPGAGPLAGIRVLDFSRFLSGPYCTRALSDMGAQVVKVESPDGDFTRVIPPHVGAFSRFYTQQNAGKQNICLDLRKPEAGETLRRLLPGFDVVIENFRPGVMAAMGLDYESARAINPRLVYASISGWGQDGPESQRAAFAVVVHAESGYALKHLHAHPVEHPVSDPFSHADVYSGLEALAGVLAALLHRERTGEGQHVDVAMMSTALSVNEHANAEFDESWPLDHVNLAPIMRYGAGQHAAIVMDPVEPVSFGRIVELFGDPALAHDERFKDQPSRVRNRDALMDMLQEFLDRFDDFDELEAALAKVKTPIGKVQTARDLAASEWARHRGAIVEVSDRQGGTIPIPNSPWLFSRCDVGVSRGPAWRGEHNNTVLTDAGMSAEEIDRLESRGVLVQDPRGIETAP
jgi:crotonobetainyl-CoA:carnitine CoA-transferase CaiB-like acyl-CoA transferase